MSFTGIALPNAHFLCVTDEEKPQIARLLVNKPILTEDNVTVGDITEAMLNDAGQVQIEFTLNDGETLEKHGRQLAFCAHCRYEGDKLVHIHPFGIMLCKKSAYPECVVWE